ncbi:TPA: hypothetical protein N0F65_011201 [Lagenidium giganteum]|uniref:3'-5' exonuclease domain-containing protein n=1 Tax=Lagenidium giganteum TaxID=4803 RepID=A0AAV2Z9E0_9STRA|nr:TPA: hypothetical protein N0F65_011201 [Lagenidium giganteum]
MTQWACDELTAPLVQRLQAGEVLETRELLRPLFRWMKLGARKNGGDDHAVEKAFAFVEWMDQLSRVGDDVLGIAQLPSLQPSFAINTIVTSSVRLGLLDQAHRALEMHKRFNYDPDVFTYTTSIDIMARRGDVDGAIKTYEEMRRSNTQPSFVTFTTIIRALGYSDVLDPLGSLTFIGHARDTSAFDDSLYLEALQVCMMRNDVEATTCVLKAIQRDAPGLRATERLLPALASVLNHRADRNEALAAWHTSGVLSTDEFELLASKSVLSDGHLTKGGLGSHTTSRARRTLVEHDLQTILMRLTTGVLVTSSDFETLIHQCRKRKWKDEIAVIVERMRDVASSGWYFNDKGVTMTIDPQPHLEPTSKTYIAVVEAYLGCEDEPMAWQTVLEMEHFPHLKREYGLYRKYVRGCYLLTNCDHIQDMLAMAKAGNCVGFSHRMCIEVARMHGLRHHDGLDIVLRQLPVPTDDKRRTYTEELIKSCAFKHNTTGVEETLSAHIAHGFPLSPSTDMSVLTCCLQSDKYAAAVEMLRHFQRLQLVMDIPMYESLLRELYFKYTRRGGTFDSASKATALKVLNIRRSLFKKVFDEKAALDRWMASSHYEQVKLGCPLQFWCHVAELECAPLMFAQHVVEVMTTSRDKEGKARAQDSIRDALFLTNDPFLYNLRAVVALRWLDLTNRSQGKLAKQMLSLLTDHSEKAPIHPHHADYCLTQLPSLTVHVVKELDDVVALHRHDRLRMLEFCLEALEKDNVDKTIGYIMTKPELYNLETAEIFAPKLAELFVMHGYNNAIQFFRTEMNDADEMRRIFLREVIELENMLNEAETGAMPWTIKAITEFKLEHEAEFMPFLLRFTPATGSGIMDVQTEELDDTEYLQLPISFDNVLIVNSEESLAVAYEVLSSPSIKRIALDAEWRPDNGHIQSKCSILQVACANFVFIFDFKGLAVNELEDLFSSLFSSTAVCKLGFGLQTDINRLQWSFPDTTCFDKFENVHDFADDDENAQDDSVVVDVSVTAAALKRKSRRRNRGLSAYVNDVVGLPLCKRQQKSDWEKRPLSPQQVTYAALDAYCLLMLDDVLHSR